MASPATLADLLQSLRAAAEPTRLRILAVCAEGELTVGEICAVLKQSQPRVSRHLKLLCDAGLLQRFREGHWVYYRVSVRGQGSQQATELLNWLDPADAALVLDRERAAQVRAKRGREAADQLSRSGAEETSVAREAAESELRAVVLQELGSESLGELLDIGTGTGRMLRWLAPNAQHAVGVDLSSDALRFARTSVHGAGLRHCVLQRADMYDLPFTAGSFDVITMDHVLTAAERPADALQEAVRILRPTGRLLVIEDYDVLDAAGEGRAAHPLATLRNWLAGVGLECRRLRPVDCADEHLILAIGSRAAALPAAA